MRAVIRNQQIEGVCRMMRHLDHEDPSGGQFRQNRPREIAGVGNVFQDMNHRHDVEFAWDEIGAARIQRFNAVNALDDRTILVVQLGSGQTPLRRHAAKGAKHRAIAATDVKHPSIFRQDNLRPQ